MNWDKINILKNKVRHGTDPAIDARLNLDFSCEVDYDQNSDYWVRRIYISDQWIDLIDKKLLEKIQINCN